MSDRHKRYRSKSPPHYTKSYNQPSASRNNHHRHASVQEFSGQPFRREYLKSTSDETTKSNSHSNSTQKRSNNNSHNKQAPKNADFQRYDHQTSIHDNRLYHIHRYNNNKYKTEVPPKTTLYKKSSHSSKIQKTKSDESLQQQQKTLFGSHTTTVQNETRQEKIDDKIFNDQSTKTMEESNNRLSTEAVVSITLSELSSQLDEHLRFSNELQMNDFSFNQMMKTVIPTAKQFLFKDRVEYYTFFKETLQPSKILRLDQIRSVVSDSNNITDSKQAQSSPNSTDSQDSKNTSSPSRVISVEGQSTERSLYDLECKRTKRLVDLYQLVFCDQSSIDNIDNFSQDFEKEYDHACDLVDALLAQIVEFISDSTIFPFELLNTIYQFVSTMNFTNMCVKSFGKAEHEKMEMRSTYAELNCSQIIKLTSSFISSYFDKHPNLTISFQKLMSILVPYPNEQFSGSFNELLQGDRARNDSASEKNLFVVLMDFWKVIYDRKFRFHFPTNNNAHSPKEHQTLLLSHPKTKIKAIVVEDALFSALPEWIMRYVWLDVLLKSQHQNEVTTNQKNTTSTDVNDDHQHQTISTTKYKNENHSSSSSIIAILINKIKTTPEKYYVTTYSEHEKEELITKCVNLDAWCCLEQIFDFKYSSTFFRDHYSTFLNTPTSILTYLFKDKGVSFFSSKTNDNNTEIQPPLTKNERVEKIISFFSELPLHQQCQNNNDTAILFHYLTNPSQNLNQGNNFDWLYFSSFGWNKAIFQQEQENNLLQNINKRISRFYLFNWIVCECSYFKGTSQNFSNILQTIGDVLQSKDLNASTSHIKLKDALLFVQKQISDKKLQSLRRSLPGDDNEKNKIVATAKLLQVDNQRKRARNETDTIESKITTNVEEYSTTTTNNFSQIKTTASNYHNDDNHRHFKKRRLITFNPETNNLYITVKK